MSTANTSLDLVNLDFDQQKAALQLFLQTQPLFKDYDFSGANINVLLDILTNNTLKNAFYLNMAISEGFIDSAQLKNTIFSHAKELNYLPYSSKSAKGTVTVSFTATGESQPYIIQKGQSFSSLVKNNSLVFSIPETFTVSSANTTFSFTTDIYEGIYVKDSYIFNNTNIAYPTFRITNDNVDLSSLVVTIYENSSLVGDTYLYTDTLLDLTSTSKVFFIQTNVADGKYEILFGDSVAGQQPLNNSVIVLDYRLSSDIQGNGASNFSINFDPTGSGQLTSSPVITTINNSTGGNPQQSVESVRFYAPRAFETQQRAVVASDYATLLKLQFPEIQALNAYGGDQMTPPQYGRVVIALAISNISGLPASKIQQYNSFITGRNMMTISPVWISPIYTYIQINTNVRYNINVSNETPNRISTIVAATINQFNVDNLNNFNTTMRFSQLTTAIDQSDISIISNSTTMKLYRKLQLTTGQATSYTINFATPLLTDLQMLPAMYSQITESVLSSSQFTYNDQTCYLADDNNGIVRIVQINNSNQFTVVQDIGTIDYTTGIVSLNNFNPSSYIGNFFLLYVKPADNDVSCAQNNIITIDPSNVNIVVTPLSQ